MRFDDDVAAASGVPARPRRIWLKRMAGLAVAPALLPAVRAADLEKPRLTLAVGGKATLYYLPLTLAERLGYFRDAGLDVEINDFPGGAKALQALIGGSADVVSGAFEHTITMQTLSQKVTAFVLQSNNPGLELAVSKARAASYSWPKDLKGWKIGVSAPGSSTHMFVNHLLASVGLTPDDVSIVGVGTGASAVAAMRGGQIDALSGVEPAMTLLEKSGDVRIVHETISEAGVRAVFGGSMPAATLYAKQSFIRANPNTIQALTNAMVRALKWLQHASTDEVAQAVPPEYLLGDRAVYLSAFQRLRPTYSPNGMFTRKAIDNSLKVLLAHNGAVRRAPVLFLNDTFTNAFVEKANAQMP
ncbi:MAG: ABC transporter substrate-binding protein [Burkholderiales bacterium]